VRAQLDCASVRALKRGSYHVVADELERLALACNVGTEPLTEGRAKLP
jgi:hypothetical protein